MNYFPIFKDPGFSFGELQVVSLVDHYFKRDEIINNIYVLDDRIIRGFIEINGSEICKLYVDSFFQCQGFGDQLIEYAKKELGANILLNCSDSASREKNMKTTLKNLRDSYVIHQVQNAKLPIFEANPIKRYRITFSGRVQKVGFRLEVCELAKKLELTGFCKNLGNGNVVAELQGPDNKIKYLISFMESLKRIKITHKVMEELVVKEKE